MGFMWLLRTTRYGSKVAMEIHVGHPLLFVGPDSGALGVTSEQESRL